MDLFAHHRVTWVIAAYLIAAIPVGVVLGWLRGVDIRAVGSGNIGATNAARALGARLGMVVLVLDVAKAALPVVLARQPFALGPHDAAGLAAVAMAAAGAYHEGPRGLMAGSAPPFAATMISFASLVNSRPLASAACAFWSTSEIRPSLRRVRSWVSSTERPSEADGIGSKNVTVT